MKKLLNILFGVATAALLVMPIAASAQSNQNAVIQGPFGGWIFSPSTSPTAKLVASSTPFFTDIVAAVGHFTMLCLGGDCRTSWPAGATPGGSNTQVQFNDSGVFAGDSAFTWDKTGNILTVPTIVSPSSLSLNGAGGAYLNLDSDVQLHASGAGNSVEIQAEGATILLNAGTGGNLQFLTNTNFATLKADALTSARTYNFPDATGTLCLTTTCTGAAFPFTATTNYNSTSTPIGFLAGLFSNSSTTLNGAVRLPGLSNGGLGVNGGLVYSGPTSTLSTISGTLALTQLATQAENTVVANGTGATAAPTAVATSTFFGSPTPGQILAFLGGKNTFVATTTFSSGLTYANGNVTNTGVTSNVAGAGISLSGSTGAVTITNTIGYPFPGNATTSALTLGGLTLSNLTGGGSLCLHVNTSGVVSAAAGDCGLSGGTVTGVTASYPIISSGGTAPNIITAFSTTTFNAFNTQNTFTSLFATLASSTNATTTNLAIVGAAANCNGTSALTTNSTGVVGCTAQPQGTVTSVSVATANGLAGSSSGGATPALTLSTTITGLLKGNGTAISTAALTDFPTQAANTVIGNGTGATAAPTAISTSSLFAGTAGQILARTAAGTWIGVATTTFNSPLVYSAGAVSCATCLTGNQTITLSGDVSGSGATAITTTIGALKVLGSMIANATIDLTTKVTGVLPVANGGTASSTLSGILKGNGTSAVQTAIAGTDYQAPISLTTTGTSGAATFVGNTLNIPNYATGGGGGGAGTWATTTSSVAGQLINYSLNTTDIVTVGGSATSTAKFSFDPNTITATFGTGGAGDSTQIFGPDSNTWALGYDATDKSFAISSSSVLGTNNALTLTKTGNVGIWQSSPATTLDVAGTIRAYLSGGTAIIKASDSTNSNYVQIYNTGTHGQLESSNDFVISAPSGAIVSGTNNPQLRVQYAGGSFHSGTFYDDDSNFTIGTNAGAIILAPTTNVQFPYASSTAQTLITLYSTLASTTNLTVNLPNCNTNSALTTNAAGVVACGAISGSGGGVGNWFTPSTFGLSASNATSTLIGFTNGLYATASSTINSLHLPLTNGGLAINGSTVYSTPTTTLSAGANITLTPSGNNIQIAASAAGGSGQSPYSWVVAPSGGDYTSIQSALDRCAVVGGGNIILTAPLYALGGTGLLWKGSNCQIWGRGAGTTTITITGAITAIAPNTTGLTHNEIHHVFFSEPTPNASSVAIDWSNMTHGIVDDVQTSGFGTSLKLNDNTDTTFYNSFTNLDFNDNHAFCINASSTNPVNDNLFQNIFCGDAATSNVIGVQINNANGNVFNQISVEPGTLTGTVGLKIFDNKLATNNGVFNNTFADWYIEANGTGISMVNTVNPGAGGIKRNTFRNMTNEANTNDWVVTAMNVAENNFNGYDSNFGVAIQTFGSPIGIGTSSLLTTPLRGTANAMLAINASTTQADQALLIGGGTADKVTFLRVSNTGTMFAPNTTLQSAAATDYWCYDANSQFIRVSNTCTVSAAKFKKDVTPLTQGLSTVLAMQPVNYYLNDLGLMNGANTNPDDTRQQIGFVADDASTTVPLLVLHSEDGEIHGFNYEQYTAILTLAIQQLNSKVEALKPAAQSAEENWQWIVIAILALGFAYQQVQINKLKK